MNVIDWLEERSVGRARAMEEMNLKFPNMFAATLAQIDALIREKDEARDNALEEAARRCDAVREAHETPLDEDFDMAACAGHCAKAIRALKGNSHERD